MSVVRWTLTNTSTGESVVLPLNPNKMSTPTTQRNMEFAWGNRYDPRWSGGLSRIRAVDQGQQQPTEWNFTGVILTKAHYDLLLAWAKRPQILRIADHLGRIFEVVIQRYDPVERLPTANRDWRADYTMTCLLLRRIS